MSVHLLPQRSEQRAPSQRHCRFRGRSSEFNGVPRMGEATFRVAVWNTRSLASGGPRFAYSPPLDGVRAFAVATVLVAHASGRINGGWVGVEVFFVLSGFLISTLLLQENDRTGKIDLLKFYERRVRRLLPALVACIALAGTLYLIDGSQIGVHEFGWAALGALFSQTTGCSLLVPSRWARRCLIRGRWHRRSSSI